MNLTWGRISVSLLMGSEGFLDVQKTILIVRLSLHNAHNIFMIINILAYTCVFMNIFFYIQTHDSDYILCSCISFISFQKGSMYISNTCPMTPPSNSHLDQPARQAVDKAVEISDDSQATGDATVTSKRSSKPMKPFQQWG